MVGATGTSPQLVFTDQIIVEVIDCNFSDDQICLAAWTSTLGREADLANPDRKKGLINRLIADRHGSPFEHNSATFRVTAPIFVWREHHRHRAGWSYNEESGRYKQLAPHFYVPGPDRHLQQVPGSSQMAYQTMPGTRPQQHLMRGAVEATCEDAYLTYLELLENGIIREMARIVLPVNIMSTCIVTCNSRALMHFLSLRQRHDDAKFPSKPMKEINLVADGYELLLKEAAPLVHQAFVANGRVAP